MAELSGLRIAVIGAGVFGLHVALSALVAGATVEVWDPARPGDNASGVAAGMIAPVGETLLDALSAAHLDLFRAGRDGWCDTERRLPGLSIDRSGCVFLFDDASARDTALASLRYSGVTGEAPDVEPGPRFTGGLEIRPTLFTPEDWRIDARSALATLRMAVAAAAGLFKAEAFRSQGMSQFDAVVLAAGAESRRFAPLAPELRALSPIKGQIVRFSGAPVQGPILRSPDVYLVPQPDGALVGATMEPGRDDRIVDPSAVERLRGGALQLLPALTAYSVQGLAGVRASTSDGLPMVGPSSAPGLFLATGARRNGWLLAPLVAQMLVSYLSGGDGGRFAAALDPRRFL